MAVDIGLKALSITDHDTLAGAKEAMACGIPNGLEFITGVEISTTYPPAFPLKGSLHILGYGFDHSYRPLNEALDTLQEARRNRNPRIIDCLNRQGFDLTYEDVLKEVTSGHMGRPHIARAMLKKGYVENINEAFDKYLATGKICYVDKYRLDSKEAIRLINEAGGVAVMAHPVLVKVENNDMLESLVKALKDSGINGIEVQYSDHKPEHVETYMKFAERYGLIMTGGSDYHGTLKKTIALGKGRGDLAVPYRFYESLVSAVKDMNSKKTG